MIKQTAKHLSQSDIAIQIERLVNAVIRHDSPAFRISYDAQGDEVIEEGLGSLGTAITFGRCITWCMTRRMP